MKLVVTLLLLFLLAQVVGLFTGYTILKDMANNPYVSGLVVTSNTQDPMNALFFIAYTLFGAVVIILVIRKLKMSMALFRVMEFVLIATSSSLVFYAVLRLGLGYDISTLGGTVLGLAFSAAKYFRPDLKNAAAIMATAGVGVIFGISMGVLPVLLFLALLSIYDFLSVFITKHMVEMANYIISKDLAFTVTAKEVEPRTKEVKRIDLGTGDLIAPVMMEISILPYSPVAALFVMLGSVTAMALFLTLVWKKKLVLPALPPIVLGMVAGLLAWYLLGAY